MSRRAAVAVMCLALVMFAGCGSVSDPVTNDPPPDARGTADQAVKPDQTRAGPTGVVAADRGSVGAFGRPGGERAWASNAPMPAMEMSAVAYKAMSGEVGVTTGGMQDIGLARRLIREGQIPSPDAITVEGLMSEHDIPLWGEPAGDALLYASASVAWTRRYGETAPVAVVQLGFGSTLDLADFERPALNLAVVVDVSGSMSSADRIGRVGESLMKLAGRLDGRDRLAVVLFNNQAWVALESQPFTEEHLEKAREVFAGLRAGGGTSIESGMKLGFEQVEAHLEEGRSARVILLTDARPNVGATSAEGFLPMLESAAARGIGVTSFGVGMDFGQELAYRILRTRSANYFYLEDGPKVAQCFDEDFDFLVSPAAYDVKVELTAAEGAEVVDALGVPDFDLKAGRVALEIPSLFFSTRGGGGASLVAIRLPNGPTGAALARMELSFQPVGTDGVVRQTLEVSLPDGLDAAGEWPWYSQPGARKAMLVADAATALRAAAMGMKVPAPDVVAWRLMPEPGREIVPPKPDGSPDQACEAAAGLGAFADWFASQIGDVDGLEPELRLIERLETSLRARAGLTAVEARPAAAPPERPMAAPKVEVF